MIHWGVVINHLSSQIINNVKIVGYFNYIHY